MSFDEHMDTFLDLTVHIRNDMDTLESVKDAILAALSGSAMEALEDRERIKIKALPTLVSIVELLQERIDAIEDEE